MAGKTLRGGVTGVTTETAIFSRADHAPARMGIIVSDHFHQCETAMGSAAAMGDYRQNMRSPALVD
jgi:hypothetical protein